jgi:hypothetical protein
LFLSAAFCFYQQYFVFISSILLLPAVFCSYQQHFVLTSSILFLPAQVIFTYKITPKKNKILEFCQNSAGDEFCHCWEDMGSGRFRTVFFDVGI